MEHNENQQTSTNELSGSPANQAAKDFDFTGTPASGTEPQGVADRAKAAAGTAGDKLADVGNAVRERAGGAKNKLAGALEAGADKLRQRAQGDGAGATLAGATADGSTPVTDGRVAQISDRVAGGMESTAEWLRDADLDGLKTGVELQVKEHPARTLLIAAGIGYLLGRAFRGNQ